MLTLRPYQLAAVDAIYRYLYSKDGNPVCMMSTGSGKSVVLAQIAKDAVTLWGGRILVVTHVRELVRQNAEKMRLLAPDIPIGIYSAGLGLRNTSEPVIFASIQSIYRKAAEFGHFDMILCDECHLVSEDADSRYQKFIREAQAINPKLIVVGFTATPYRLASGELCRPDAVFNEVCFETSIKELINEGYLCPLTSKAGEAHVDTSKLKVRGNDFIGDEMEKLMNTNDMVTRACAEITQKIQDRKACIIFACTIRHAKNIAEVLLNQHGIKAREVFGGTPRDERDEIVRAFKAGEFKVLVNVGVLTTGFDAPHIDCIALLRPTFSTGLYVQMVGRGLRTHPDKKDCLVLDFGNNVMKHGPIDQVRFNSQEQDEDAGRICPTCSEIVAKEDAICPSCGFEFEQKSGGLRDVRHELEATSAPILSNSETEALNIQKISYFMHYKREAYPPSPPSLRVIYETECGQRISEWVCFEHKGYAQNCAVKWWRKRSELPIPKRTAEAHRMAMLGTLKEPGVIHVAQNTGSRFPRIMKYEFTCRPTISKYDPQDFLNYSPNVFKG